jgi:acyl carrier protein
MTDTEQLVLTVIANTLGVETTDITPTDDFSLDLNATPSDMRQIRIQLEEMLEITLPNFDDADSPATVSELMEIIEDSLL